ncbi:MAG: 1-deoxy-D-xylulose-5-phosphate reductoisomerase, partial [Candidatus Omnitrophota bacterium]
MGKKKKVLVFGSTGSVGRNSLEVIEKNKDKFEVIGICSNSNTKELTKQIKKFRPKYVCLKDKEASQKLPNGKEFKLLTGQAGLEEFARLSSDVSIMAISRINCLKPLIINIAYAKRIALANKETVVTAAKFIFSKAEKYKTEIIPVDSEINAIFQLLNLIKPDSKDIDKIYITASGGALLDY